MSKIGPDKKWVDSADDLIPRSTHYEMWHINLNNHHKVIVARANTIRVALKRTNPYQANLSILHSFLGSYIDERLPDVY